MKARWLLLSAAAAAISLGLTSPLSVSAAPEPTDPTDGADSGLLLLVASLGDDVFATTDLSTVVTDPGTMHFGPYPSTSTDSSTCGVPDWATDTFNRFFTIRPTAPSTFSVYEQFRDGSFTTMGTPEPSPGSCGSGDGGVIESQVTGQLHGYLAMTITSGTYHPETASCASPCFSTNDFLASVFGPAFVRNDNAWFFRYVAPNQDLALQNWKNAACNRGGNSGDIATTITASPNYILCP